MAIAAFANKVFEVNTNKVYTFDGIQYSSSLQTEKQDSDGSKPSTYIKGPDLDTLEFKLTLDIIQGVNPRSEWEEWQSIMSSQKACQFILGSKPVGKYSWLLTGVTPGNLKLDNVGNILSMELDLKFDEYVRAGSASSNKNTSTSSAPGISEPSNVNVVDQLGVEGYADEYKASGKRDNYRMSKQLEY